MKIVDPAMASNLMAAAAELPRLRKNLNLHDGPADPIQRFLNAIEPDSYVRPHRHDPGKWELMVLLSGRAALLSFDDEGYVTARCDLMPGTVIETPAGTWHTLVSLATGTLFFEVKPGPYLPAADKNFAAWAPPEGHADSREFFNRMRSAQVGQRL